MRAVLVMATMLVARAAQARPYHSHASGAAAVEGFVALWLIGVVGFALVLGIGMVTEVLRRRFRR